MAELIEWLERTEVIIRQSEPVDLTEPKQIIQAKYDKFKVKLALHVYPEFQISICSYLACNFVYLSVHVESANQFLCHFL